ncbi:MAG: hypothetical protein A2Y17_11045 [Clostridiales bacterium GWF2_38_85]|nr:MAG: hypothetical protein A2Y17_11045 [Clostridiales bacterium GWF2_38_85]HBL84663.1 hypothetical protein [Clostridiales bacterium]
MPSMKKINKTMLEQGISDDILTQFDFSEENNQKSMITLIDQMDKLLTKEQCFAIMEQQGCCKGGKRDKDCKAFGKLNSKKSIAEKLMLISSVDLMMTPQSIDDGMFTITMTGYQNGVHEGKTTCSCGMIKKLKQPFLVSPTYCGCCAGHFRYHYQNMLGAAVKLKEIISSPLNTNGEKPCQFLFEIEKKPTLDNVAVYTPDDKINTVNMFIDLAKRTNLKSEIKYTKPKVIDLNINKGYKCVFSKAKRVIFTLDFSRKHFSVKANLYNIDKYKDSIDLSVNILSQMQNGAWDCAWYSGGTCSDKCRRGIPITLNGKTEYKCIGGAFTFHDFNTDEWQQIMMLVEKELSV